MSDVNDSIQRHPVILPPPPLDHVEEEAEPAPERDIDPEHFASDELADDRAAE